MLSVYSVTAFSLNFTFCYTGFYVTANDFDFRFLPADFLAKRNASKEILFLLF